MTRTRLLTASLAAVLGLTACEGLKEAMTAHVDTVARAGSQELTVTRLAELVGPTDVPLQADAIRTIAQLWVNYQLLGHAAARGDSLFTDADAELGMWSAIAQMRSRKLYDELAKGWSGNLDPATFEKAYNDGVLGYNNKREVFPNNLVAGMFAFGPASFLELDDPAKREVPKVSFT